jgi:hypothetical protein
MIKRTFTVNGFLKSVPTFQLDDMDRQGKALGSGLQKRR